MTTMDTRPLGKKISLNVQLFLQGAMLSYIALFRWLRPIPYLASKVVAPLSYMLFFVFLGKYATGNSDASFYVIGNAMHMAAGSGIFGVTMSIGGDRNEGTLPYLFATPANRLVMFVGRAAIHVLDGMLGVVIGFTWGVLLLGLDLSQTNIGALAVAVIAATFATSGMGLLMGCLSLITRNVMFVNNTVFFALLVFSGANVNLAETPAWVQILSQWLPLTRSIAAARTLIAGGTLADVAPLLRAEALIGLAYILAGYSLFRWFEFQAKKRGTLEVF